MKTSLENVPVEIRKALIRKVRQCISEGVQMTESCIVPCPNDPTHFTLFRYAQFHGIEMFMCNKCGYRYVMMKQGGELTLVNQPERKQLVIRRKT
jgi:hypothetical protein